MKNTKKIPQVEPTWNYGIYTGKAVVTREPYGYHKGVCQECDRDDGTHFSWCGAIN